jgi:hypothetical protein
MTRYTVAWIKSSHDELAEIWLVAPDLAAVTAAAQAIDRELTEDAPRKGVDLREGLRALFAPPLRVIYSVREEDCVVEVVRVRCL